MRLDRGPTRGEPQGPTDSKRPVSAITADAGAPDFVKPVISERVAKWLAADIADHIAASTDAGSPYADCIADWIIGRCFHIDDDAPTASQKAIE
jgi:hypothetical protein